MRGNGACATCKRCRWWFTWACVCRLCCFRPLLCNTSPCTPVTRCFQLDGETNLKLRRALNCTVAYGDDGPAAWARFRGCVQCEQPTQVIAHTRIGQVASVPGLAKTMAVHSDAATPRIDSVFIAGCIGERQQSGWCRCDVRLSQCRHASHGATSQFPVIS